MNIITREQWNARPPRHIHTTTWERRSEFVVHYTAGTPTQSVRSVQDYCMDNKGYSDIDYNALVDQHGRVYEGRTGIWLTVGSHNLNRNTVGIGVCYLGNNSTPLTDAAKRAFAWLYGEANRLRRAAGVSGTLALHVHSDHRPTSCPGDALREWVKAGMPIDDGEDEDMFCAYGDKGGPKVEAMQRLGLAAGGSLPRFGADGDYGDETAAMLQALTGGDGKTYGPAQHVALQVALAKTHAGQGKPGPSGPSGPKGDAAVIEAGTTLVVR